MAIHQLSTSAIPISWRIWQQYSHLQELKDFFWNSMSLASQRPQMGRKGTRYSSTGFDKVVSALLPRWNSLSSFGWVACINSSLSRGSSTHFDLFLSIDTSLAAIVLYALSRWLNRWIPLAFMRNAPSPSSASLYSWKSLPATCLWFLYSLLFHNRCLSSDRLDFVFSIR